MSDTKNIDKEMVFILFIKTSLPFMANYPSMGLKLKFFLLMISQIEIYLKKNSWKLNYIVYNITCEIDKISTY